MSDTDSTPMDDSESLIFDMSEEETILPVANIPQHLLDDPIDEDNSFDSYSPVPKSLIY